MDDFYGAEHPNRASNAFHELQSLFDCLGLQASQEKDCPPATTMIYLGIEVDTNTFCLRVPRERLDYLLLKLQQWKTRTSYRSSESFQAITYSQFSRFLAKSLQAIGANSSTFSPHSFGRGGATFAFYCGLPAELIKLQGDWRSDAYLVYLEMTDRQKRAAVTTMANTLKQIGL